VSPTRRDFLRTAVKVPAGLAAARVLSACGGSAKPASSSTKASTAPSGKPIKIGFIALTDCASVVMAKELGYYQERGLNVEIVKQASWPATRDNLLNGDIDASHGLFSLPISLAAGIGGKPEQVIKIAMILNNNGQTITLSNKLAGAGYADLAKVKEVLQGHKGSKLAMTFPGGTHDTWLRYWVKAAGVPFSDLEIIPIPPPQMVANMKVGTMNGFCVGEPWGAQAVLDNIGYSAINTQDIWENHPEKALIVNPNFESTRRDELKEVMGAILKASKWLDNKNNRAKAAQTVGVPAYVGAQPAVIEGRMLGAYDLGGGLGKKAYEEDYMRFYRDGKTNAPRHSYVMWFLAQYQRFGILKSAPDYRKIADTLILRDLYEEVAKKEGVPVPDDDMAPFEVKLDGATFDPAAPEKEAARV
jgi:nitrate/nitrite transport system substrate-binding protein